MLRTGVIFLALSSLLPAQKINLVQHGKEAFHAVGCAECHSETKNDTAVKTGPGLYGLFQKEARSREIITAGEAHRHTVKVDLKYYQSSLKNPHAELAVAESGVTKGEPYLPVMPLYPVEVLSSQQQKAIFHYLQTLNDEGQRGPAEVMAKLDKSKEYSDPNMDPGEILVTDRTRILRARVNGSSARAIYVGTPSGLNYAFDPRTLSITKVWWGGFLNMKEEMTGRGGKVSVLGHEAQEIKLGAQFYSPIDPNTGKPVDLSFKSPRFWDKETIAKNLNSEKDFAEHLRENDAKFIGYTYPETKDGHPTFFYQVGKNKISLTVSLVDEGEVKLSFQNNGPAQLQLTSGILQIDIEPELSASATTSIKQPEKLWRPAAKKSALVQKITTASMEKMILLPGYSAERIPAPTDPHGRPQLFEPMGMATDADGSIVVTTRTAGIWRYHEQTWTMIGEGTLDALGVVIDGNDLIVGQKPELSKLIDTNADGFYDYYVTLSDDFVFTGNYHEYLHGPAKGKDGNYYIALNLSEKKGSDIYKANGKWMGTTGSMRGWTLQVTPEGVTTAFAFGLRSPAGLSTGPDGELYYTENQGEYNGTSKVHIIQKDKYYGHPCALIDLPGMTPTSPEITWDKWSEKTQPAVALLPHSRLANSPGSPVWDTSEGKFGPFTGEMFIGDQTLSNLFRVKTKPNHEAAVIPFAQGFPSGVMRPCFGKDGSLYVGQTGRGWRSRGGSEHALVRLKWDGKTAVTLMDVSKKGIEFHLSFSGKVDEEALKDVKIDSWSYHDKPTYGSPENEKRSEKIDSVTLDGTTVIVKVAGELISGSRIYQITSPQLPRNTKAAMEAFYTITK